MNRSVKKMALELKSILQREVINEEDSLTADEESVLLDVFLSFIVLRVLQAKRNSLRADKNELDSDILGDYFSGVQLLNRDFDCCYLVDKIKNRITRETIEKVRELFQSVKDEDWKKEEIISWSYQYFNEASLTASKDLKAKNGAISQFYTPKWIVDYLVENTLGKYYTDDKGVDVEDVKIIDPACGCGNFVIGVYDKLKEMYQKRGYDNALIAKLIITKNLYGIDIDENAVEITNLLLRLKALEDGAYEKIETNIVAVPEESSLTANEYLKKFEKIGSLMRTEDVLSLKESGVDDERLKKALDVLTLKYDIVLTNPPYLDSSDYDFELKRYINEDYSEFKKNLYACFIKKSYELVKTDGFVGMITPQTFMFIASYEKTRRFILNNFQIERLVHFGLGGVFDNALVDTAMFVLRKSEDSLTASEEGSLGGYINLTAFNGKDSKKKALFSIWKEKREDYISKYVFRVDKRVFTKVPRFPFIYWVNSDVVRTFENEPLDKFADARQGIATGDNKRFLRYFWEVRREDISFDHIKDERQPYGRYGKKWVPYAKGGPYNKWYGNLWWVIAFDEENYNLLSKMGNYLPNRKYYFKKGITYTMTTSKGATFRYLPSGFLFDCKGSSLFFSKDEDIFRFLGLLNSSLFSYLESFIAGSVDLEVGDLKKLPVPQGLFEDSSETQALEALARLNVAIKKQNIEIYPNELHFNEESIDSVSQFYGFIESKNALDTYLLLSEGLIDVLVMELYSLKERNFEEIYKTVGIPTAFFPFAGDKGVDGLPPLKELLKSQYLYEFGLKQAELIKVEKLIGDVYNNKIKTLSHLLPFDEGITNYHRREPYDNYVERKAEESFQNPVKVYNNMGNQEEILKKLGFITIDNGIQKYLLNGDTGFIPFGFSIEEENRLLSTLFKERSELERIVKKELRGYVFKDYLKLHKKFYKDRPIVWKLGNRDRGFLVHYHNLNEKTKSNILGFLRKRIKETASQQMRNENKSFRDLMKIIESKNFEVNIDDGVVKNSAIF
ncbi:Eco57I restriction-modification methylase domain-containing protein [Petrotoga sp. DB-2]